MKLWAKHILLSHEGAQNSTHNRPLGVAMQDAELLIKDLKAGKSTFEECAAKNSACPSGQRSGGDLGWFEEQQMVPDFAEACKKIPIDEIGPPVVTPFGVHIILRKG